MRLLSASRTPSTAAGLQSSVEGVQGGRHIHQRRGFCYADQIYGPGLGILVYSLAWAMLEVDMIMICETAMGDLEVRINSVACNDLLEVLGQLLSDLGRAAGVIVGCIETAVAALTIMVKYEVIEARTMIVWPEGEISVPVRVVGVDRGAFEEICVARLIRPILHCDDIEESLKGSADVTPLYASTGQCIVNKEDRLRNESGDCLPVKDT